MIKTISMRIEPVRPPRTLTTHRATLSTAQALGLAVAAALTVICVAAALFCPGFAHAAAAAKPSPQIDDVAATSTSAEEAMSAVRSLSRFPDPYPAVAGVGP